MKPAMTILLLLSLMMLTVPRVSGANLDCKKQLDVSDRCAARALMIGSSRVIIPSTLRELEEGHCKRINQNVKCIAGYTPCLKGMPKVLFNLVLRNIKLNFKKLCGTMAGKNEIMRHLQCFDSDNIEILHNIVDKLTVTFDYVAKEVELNQTLPWTCCGFFKLLEEGKRQLDDLCIKRTGPATSKFIMSVLSSIASEATDLTCGRYSSVRLCRQRLPSSIDKFEQITRKFDKPGFTPLVPLLGIADKISNHPGGRSRG